MTKKLIEFEVTIGVCKSGRIISIPLDLNDESAEEVVRKFSTEEQVDLYCLLEYKILRHYLQKYNGIEQNSLETLFNILQGKFNSDPFYVLLESLNLATSLSRVRYGKMFDR